MKQNSKLSNSKFVELSSKWASGEEVYKSSITVLKTCPDEIFQVAFSNQSRGFLDELTTKSSSSNQSPISKKVSPWKSIEQNSKKYLQQRTLQLKSSESGLAFFLKKNITTNITQTVFFNKDGSICIFSTAESRTDAKAVDHIIIDKWDIKFENDTNMKERDENKRKVSVSINAKILWKQYQINPTATIVKSKWLRFYQARFEKWRKMIKKYVTNHQTNEVKRKQMKPYLGVWNKVNSYHNIKIGINKIVYSDGSQFDASVNILTNGMKQIIATYVDGKFSGTLNKNLDSIKWNNGSVWIKQGNSRFAGEYQDFQSDQIYSIHKNGQITLPITKKKVRFMLTGPNTICYSLSKSTRKAKLNQNDGSLKWDNGHTWKRLPGNEVNGNTKNNIIKKPTKFTKTKTKTNREEPKIQKIVAKSCQKSAAKNLVKETEEIIGEVSNKCDDHKNATDDVVIDDNQMFRGCFDGEYVQLNTEIMEENDRLLLCTENLKFDHFVVLDQETNKNEEFATNHFNHKIEEWLLV